MIPGVEGSDCMLGINWSYSIVEIMFKSPPTATEQKLMAYLGLYIKLST